MNLRYYNNNISYVEVWTPVTFRSKAKNVRMIKNFPGLRIQTLAINDSFVKYFMKPITP